MAYEWIVASNAVLRFMSNLCRLVEFITESLVGNINLKLSIDLKVKDKRREGVTCSVGPLLTYLPNVQQETKTSALHYQVASHAGVFFFYT